MFHKHPNKADGRNPTCKECRKSMSKDQYNKHKNSIKKRTNEYYYNNKERIKEKQREYNKKRRETDIKYVLARRLRNRLYYALKNKNWKKTTHFSEYIGCSREYLVSHLESKFEPGMSWDSYGGWHIDHIVPLSSAKSEEEMYKLCHYTNLQPLWATDNIRKGNNVVVANKKDYTVKPIPNKLSHDFILNIHYAKRLPPISHCFGLFKGDSMVGICSFSKPTGRHVSGHISHSPESVLELNRLVLKNNLKNEASMLVSRSLKMLPKKSIIVSFADSNQNHLGIVYQACNFKYYGTTLPRKEFQSDMNVHSSTAAKDPEKYNAKLGDRSLKHRYIYTKDYSRIKLLEQPYPKKYNQHP